MKRTLLIIIILCGFINVDAQIYQAIPGFGFKWQRVSPDSVLHLPRSTDTALRTNQTTLPQIRQIGDSTWAYTGSRWVNISRGVDSVALLSKVVRTFGTQSVAGVKTFTDSILFKKPFVANADIAAFGTASGSTIKMSWGATSDFTSVKIGDSFSLNRNGGGDPSIVTVAKGLLTYSDHKDFYGPLSGAIRLPPDIRLTGNYGLGIAKLGAYNGAASAIYFGNGMSDYIYNQITYARNGQWMQNDTSTIPTYSASAIMSLQSTKKGFAPPRMTTAQRDAITSPIQGLQIYNTTTNRNNFYNGSQWLSNLSNADTNFVSTVRYTDSADLARLPIVNVKSYGALGNGIADDRAAIRAAAAYAEQNGLPLYFPSGTYNTSGNLTQATTRTNTTSLSILFGNNVKIKVIDTANFDVPSNRVLFGYYTGTVPHSFSVTGGNVEIDGNNMINAAFVVSQTTNENLGFKINCAILTIKNLYSNSFANSNTHAIYTLGSYPLMEIMNVTIDSLNREATTNATLATQAILISGQNGVTLIDNVVIKNIGSNLLTQDCDGIVARGSNVVLGNFIGGDFTISNSYIINSRGRGVKAQSSTVKVYNTTFKQTDLAVFSGGSSVDFQLGNGVVDGCTFEYSSGTIPSSFSSIAFQERVRFVNLLSKAVNNKVKTKTTIPNFIVVLSSFANSASADIIVENNNVIPFDTTVSNIFTRAFVEFTANELQALPASSVWDFTIKNNQLMTTENLLGYTGYTSGDISAKIRLNISGNINNAVGKNVFDNLSGNRITKVSKYRLKGNSGFSNLFPLWTVDFTRGALMGDNEFLVNLASCTFTNAPASLPTTGYALIQVGDSSSQGQMRRINVRDSSFQYYLYASNWVEQPTAASLYVTKAAITSTTGYVPKTSGAATLNNSNIFDDGTNVGIGTISPSTKLEIVGGFNVGDGITTLRSVSASGLALFGTLTNHPLVFRTNNTARGRITENGNFLYGTTVVPNGNPIVGVSGKVHISDSLKANVISTISGTSTQALIANGTTIRLEGGSYTSGLTNVTNVSSSALTYAKFTRVGNIVTAHISLTVSTSASGLTVIRVGLPANATSGTWTLSGSANTPATVLPVAFDLGFTTAINAKFFAVAAESYSIDIVLNYEAS